MGERGRPRDLYDIVNLYRRRDLRVAPELIRTVLVEKCKAKRVPIPTYESALASRDELRGEWENMLAHQLPALPPLETFWEELPGFFAWLEGTAQIEELPVIPPSPG
jgi:predicted nucleotidyltransferase component of viral defense system